MNSLIGQKIGQSQRFLEDGRRIPVTEVYVPASPVVSVKTLDKNGYSALQIGFGNLKKANKAKMGHVKGANLEKAPKFLREVRVENIDSEAKIGEQVSANSVFKEGDIVDVTGTSKGKGYAGGVKRYHFKGGPRTHGQSDRERAPGSIGQTTTPGRVYKGKRMAGRMGHDKVTVKNLEIIEIKEDKILIKGQVPGGKNSIVMVKKVGENKKFVPLYKEEEAKTEPEVAEEEKIEAKEEPKEEVQAQSQPAEEVKIEEPKTEEITEEIKEDKENAS